MIKLIKNVVFSFIEKNENFLVVEIGLQGAQITKISANFASRIVKILARAKVDVNDSLADAFKKIDGGKDKIILILESRIGFTIYSKVTARLPGGFLSESDFENFGIKVLQKFFDSNRDSVAQKLNVGSSDVVLIDARILGANFGGEFSNSEIYYTITCATKSWAEEIFKVISDDRIVMCVEGVASFGRAMGHIFKNQSFIFSYSSSKETEVLEVDGSNIKYFDSFSCGTEEIFNELALQSRFTKSIIKYVVNSYHDKIGPAVFLDQFGASLMREYKIIENGLREAVSKSSLKFLYIASSEIVPDFISKVHIKNKLGHFVKIFTVSHNFISEKLGFEVKYKIRGGSDDFQIALAGLFDFYLSPQQDLFLKIVKRKIKWNNQYVG